MVPNVQWGDVPQFVEAAGVWAAVLFQRTQRHRQNWAEEWPKMVEQLSQLTSQDIDHLIADRPIIAEMVGTAWVAAAQTAAEEKRWLLARVVVEAMHRTDDAEIDELPFLLRTVTHLEPPHIRLLVLIAMPRAGRGQMANTQLEGYLTPNDMRELWPQAINLIDPMTALLSREGLIENRAFGTYDSGIAWGATAYGKRLLRFIPDDSEWAKNRDSAEVVLRLDASSFLLGVRNLGPGMARSIELQLPRRSDGSSLLVDLPAREAEPDPFDLQAETEKRFPIHPTTISDRPPYRVSVRWLDGLGNRKRWLTVDSDGSSPP